MPKFFLFFLISLLSLPGFSQEEAQEKNPFKALQAIDQKNITALILTDSKVQAIVQQLIQEGYIEKIPAQTLKDQIYSNVKDTFWEKPLRKFPVIVDLSVEIIRNKEALGGLFGILIRKDDLKTYGYIWLAIFVFSSLFKSRIIKPKWPFMKRFFWSMSISFILSVLSLGIFYNFFAQELNPSLAIIGKHLF